MAAAGKQNAKSTSAFQVISSQISLSDMLALASRKRSGHLALLDKIVLASRDPDVRLSNQACTA